MSIFHRFSVLISSHFFFLYILSVLRGMLFANKFRQDYRNLPTKIRFFATFFRSEIKSLQHLSKRHPTLFNDVQRCSNTLFKAEITQFQTNGRA
jgi:hypothetical protein